MGKATTSQGKPVAGMSVRLQLGRRSSVWIPGMGSQQRIVYTGPDGAFRIPGVPPGTHQLQGSPLHPQHRAQPAKVTVAGTGEHRADIAVAVTASVHGTALGADGKPLARGMLYVRLEPAGPGPKRYVPAGHPDDAGRFRIAGVLPGAYSVTVTLTRRGKEAGLVAPAPSKTQVKEGADVEVNVTVRKK